jgi:hypothetical protein
MKIQIVTETFKKATRFLNISLLIFCLFMIISFISFWFSNSEFMKNVGAISLLATGVLILTSIILVISRHILKKAIEINEDQIEALIINSHVDVSQIKDKKELGYFGNRLQIMGGKHTYELKNTTAFGLLKSSHRIKTSNTTSKVRSLEIPPKEILKDVAGALFGWS